MRAPHTATPPDSAEDWPLGRLLSTAARLVEHDWNSWLAQLGITHAGLLALHALRAGPMTQRALAAHSQVEEQTMSRVLERLERNGHVTRRRDAVDRRRLVVERTTAGAAVAEDAVKDNAAERLVVGRVQDPEAFRAELVRLITAVRANRQDAEPGVESDADAIA